MKYQVIARKFRPQAFEDVVGQDPIVQTLRNAIEMGRIGHAYLFSGPRGVGKTTMARLLAKALNCETGPTISPCNACASCTEIATGGSIDVLEIDAASNTGVDSIRELRENARYAPSRDRFKIFIIDEVHMLSTSAFNALLKTLEEPPSHIAFIMATTERHKLPATVLSRCQQFVFRSIPPAEILGHLKTIAEGEGIRIGEGALEYVVKAAGGSMRDAQSLLDQIIAFGGQEVSDADVRDVLGFMPADLLSDALDALARRDPAALLGVVERVVDQGLNLQQFVRELLADLRNLLLSKIGLDDKISGSPDDRVRIAAQAAGFSEQDLVRFFDILMQAETDLRWTSEPRFHMEVACVKLTEVGKLRDLEDVIRDLRSGSPVGEPPSRAAAPAAGLPPAPQPAAARPPAPEPRVEARPVAPSSRPTAADAPPKARRSATAAGPGPAATRPEVPTSPSPERPSASEARAAATGEADTSLTPHADSEAMTEAARAEPLVQSFLEVYRGEIAHVRSNKESRPEEDR